MFISFSSEENYPHPELLLTALEHLRPAIGPLRFRVEVPGGLNGTIPFRHRRDGQALKGGLGLLVGIARSFEEAGLMPALTAPEVDRDAIAALQRTVAELAREIAQLAQRPPARVPETMFGYLKDSIYHLAQRAGLV